MGLRLVPETKVAEMLNVQLRTVRLWRKENRGPKYHTFGRKIMYDIDDIKNYEIGSK